MIVAVGFMSDLSLLYFEFGSADVKVTEGVGLEETFVNSCIGNKV